MTEHLAPQHPEDRRSPGARPATEPGELDWRRLEVAMNRFGDHLAAGISKAIAEHSEIDESTARTIAHVLGRGYGRASALAEFGRTGNGDYLNLRDEYLDIYNREDADNATKELIDWLGTHLVQRERTSSGRRFMNEHLPPKLELLLVDEAVTISGERFQIHVPANLDSAGIATLEDELQQLDLEKDNALQAFLMLPDVNANDQPIMEAFHTAYIGVYFDEEAALEHISPVLDLERELGAWAADNGLPAEAVTLDHRYLYRQLEESFDVISWKGYLYVFEK